MLADLERGEVEPERAELPAQVLQLAVRHPFEAVRDERGLELGEFVIECAGIGVAAGPRRGLAGQAGPGPTQSLGDEPEPLAVRLVREAASQQAVRLGQLLGVAREARRERPGPPAWTVADRRRRRPPRPVCISRVATAS